MEEGWIKVYRKIKDWTWFNDRYTLHLFMYLLVSVNREDGECNGIKVKAGSLATNVLQLADILDMSRNYVKRSIRNLVETGELEVEMHKTNARLSIFTVKNWKKYQSDGHSVMVTPCPSQRDGHSDGHNVTNTLPYNKKKQEDVINSAHASDGQNVMVTDCWSQNNQQKNDTDIPQAPYNPSQGYGAPPIIPYPQTAKEVMDTAALRGIAMTEAEANDFINYYGGLGWTLGKSPIRNWTMFIPKWHENSKNRSVNNGTTRNGFDRKHVASADEFGEGDQY